MRIYNVLVITDIFGIRINMNWFIYNVTFSCAFDDIYSLWVYIVVF